MKQTRLIMGMPITLHIPDSTNCHKIARCIFAYFSSIDRQFSPYKKTSEVSLINQGLLNEDQYSPLMSEIIALSRKTHQQTQGYFDVYHQEKFDPSGIVKGFALHYACRILDGQGITNYYLEAGGDIEVKGVNANNQKWKIGIRNPFNTQEVVKVIRLTKGGVATSGTYFRGNHIYTPHVRTIGNSISLTVIGPNSYEADRLSLIHI